jgi:hypothetical protein
MGEQSDHEKNAFTLETVELNVPGSKGYRPGRPWISKRRRDGIIAADVLVFVDDGRSTKPTEEVT